MPLIGQDVDEDADACSHLPRSGEGLFAAAVASSRRGPVVLGWSASRFAPILLKSI